MSSASFSKLRQVRELLLHQVAQPHGDVGVLRGVTTDAIQRHAVHGQLVLALADQIGGRDLLEVEQIERELIDSRSAAARRR